MRLVWLFTTLPASTAQEAIQVQRQKQIGTLQWCSFFNLHLFLTDQSLIFFLLQPLPFTTSMCEQLRYTGECSCSPSVLPPSRWILAYLVGMLGILYFSTVLQTCALYVALLDCIAPCAEFPRGHVCTYACACHIYCVLVTSTSSQTIRWLLSDIYHPCNIHLTVLITFCLMILFRAEVIITMQPGGPLQSLTVGSDHLEWPQCFSPKLNF
jgi:hypothetical protein